MMNHDSYSWLEKLEKIKNKSGEVKAQIQALKTRHQAAKDLKETGKPLSHYANAFFNYREAIYQSPIAILNSPLRDCWDLDYHGTKLGVPTEFAGMFSEVFLGMCIQEPREYLQQLQSQVCFDVFTRWHEAAIEYAKENPAKSHLISMHALSVWALDSKPNAPDEEQFSGKPLTEELLRCSKWLFDTVNDDTLDFLSLAAKREGIEGDIVHSFIPVVLFVVEKNEDLLSKLPKEQHVLISERLIVVASKLLERYPNCLHLHQSLRTSYKTAYRFREAYITALRGLKLAEDAGFHYEAAVCCLDVHTFIQHAALGPIVRMAQLQPWCKKARTNLELCKEWLPKNFHDVVWFRYEYYEEICSSVPAETCFPSLVTGVSKQLLVKHVPDMAHRCDYCGEEEVDRTFRKCACRQTRYCSVECQEKHWPLHEIRCSVAVSRRREETRAARENASSSSD